MLDWQESTFLVYRKRMAQIINLDEKAGLTARKSLDTFLAGAEQRLYRTAILTTKKSADALDIVQDTMLQLVQYYRDRDESEWPLLLQRILHNKIMDWHRAQAKQRRWFWQAPNVQDEDESDILDVVDERAENPAELIARSQDVKSVIAALEQLPLRQRQAFLLRAWEGFDVAATAEAMECSEGSVKTHYFRAIQSLRELLLI